MQITESWNTTTVTTFTRHLSGNLCDFLYSYILDPSILKLIWTGRVINQRPAFIPNGSPVCLLLQNSYTVIMLCKVLSILAYAKIYFLDTNIVLAININNLSASLYACGHTIICSFDLFLCYCGYIKLPDIRLGGTYLYIELSA